PTNTMVHRAQVAHYARNAARLGVKVSEVAVDLAKIVAQRDEVVLSFRGGQQRRVDDRKNLRLYRSRARFVAPHQVQVGEAIIESEKISLTPAAARTFRRFQDCAKCRFSPTNPSSSLPRFPNTCSFLAAATSASNSGKCSGVTEAA